MGPRLRRGGAGASLATAAPCHSLLGCWDYVFTASVIANFEAGKKGFIWETLWRFVTESMEKAKRVCESK